MKEIYITIAGMNYYYGVDLIEKNMENKQLKIKLTKEPDNEYDSEAIKAELAPFGIIGHVANSTYTVIGNCYSAGRLYDKMGDTAYAVPEYVTDKGVICKVLLEEAFDNESISF